MGRPEGKMPERFWSKTVPGPGGCIIWATSLRGSNGYGAFWWKRRNRMAHHVAWELTNGLVAEGSQVLHTCDVPRCVNPHHLYLGTNEDNVADRVSRGRGIRGSMVAQSKLTEQQVLSIKRDFRSIRVLAREYGVTSGTIAHIRAGRNWSWLELDS